MRQGAQGWCTGMTQRNGMVKKVGGGFRMAKAYTHGGFISIYDKTTIIF